MIETMRYDIQLISLLVIIFIVVGLIKWSNRDRLRWLWSIGILLWAVHMAIYYTVVLLNPVWNIMPDSITGGLLILATWSSILRLHGNIAIAWIIFYLVRLNGAVDNHGH